MNTEIFYFFYNLSSIPFIAKLSLFLSYPFTYGVIFFLIVWVIFLSKRKMFNFSLLFLSGIFSWTTAALLKLIFHINRPFIAEGVIPLYKETGFSMPSEHMAVFTAIAVSIFLISKRAGIIFSIIAILIGLSRIIIGVHYPLDIVVGAIVGLCVSLIITKIFKKI